MIITTQDVYGLIGLGIKSDKLAFIQSMNASGNTVPANISDDDLYEKAITVFENKGFSSIQNILRYVKLDTSKLNTDNQNILIKKFGLVINPSSKCDFTHPLECVTGFTGYIGDLIGGTGTTVVVPPTQTQTSSSSLSSGMMALIVVGGVIGIAIFRKFTIVVIGIIVIVVASVLYGIFAKKITTVVTGGGTTSQSHGGIGSAIASLLAFL